MCLGIIIVDHGSRRTQSNELLEEVARQFGQRFNERFGIVEPAHMELAEPSIATAFAACVKRGASRVVVLPFFLGPGKHWTSDIPSLTASAAVDFPGVQFHIAQTLGIDDLILDLLAKRVGHCQSHAFSCEACQGTLRAGDLSLFLAPVASSAESTPGEIKTCSTCPYKGMPLPAAV